MPSAPPSATAATLPARWAVAVVLAAFAFIHLGYWHAGGYLGDESSYLYEALQTYQQGTPVRSLYYHAYHVIFALGVTDPLAAHLLLRLAVSLVVSLGLWAWLRSFAAVGPYAAVITTCWWISSATNVPLVQMGLAPLFCLALVLPALAWAVRDFTLTRWLVLVLAVLAAATARPEYLAPALLLTVYGVARLVLSHLRGEAPWRTQVNRWTLLPLAGLAVVVFLFVGRPSPAGRGNYDSYLLTGLAQGYAQRYVHDHPEVQLNPYREAARVTDEVFGAPHGFSEAARHNFPALAGYLAANGLDNLRQCAPLLLVQRVLPGLPITRELTLLQVALLILVALAGLVRWLLVRRAARLAAEDVPPAAPATPPAPEARAWFHRVPDAPRLVVPLLVATAAGLPLLVHVAEPRLWLTLVPLVYLGLAWGLTQLLALARAPWVPVVLLAVVALWWCAPLFPGASSNQTLVRSLREYGRTLDHVPVLGGPSCSMLATYAFGTRFTAHEDLNETLLAGLKEGRYDAFLVGSVALLGSAFAQEHREFIQDLLSHPEHVGYRALPAYEGEEETLYLFLKLTPAAPPEPAGR